MLNRRTFLEAALFGAASPDCLQCRESLPSFDDEVSFLIVGAGGAGLSAAVSCAEQGLKDILVIEKAPSIGGNTLISSGLFNAVDPKRQLPMGIKDPRALFTEQTLREGDFKNDRELVSKFTLRATETLEWLESLGMTFKPQVSEGYGSMFPRSHLPVEPHGSGYIRVLHEYLKRAGIEIRTNCRLVKIHRDAADGSVIGCTLEENGRLKTIRVRAALFLGAGGFSQNDVMCSICDPRLAGLSSTNQPFATGDALIAAIETGASVSNLEFIECIPGKLPGQKERTVLHLFVGNMIWLNRQGERFVAEDGRRDMLRDALLGQEERSCFAIVDKKGFEFLDKEHREALGRALRRNEAFVSDSIEDLAKQIDLPSESVKKTVNRYNRFVEQGRDDDFGKKRLLQKIETPPFYACAQSMNRHYCVGGVRITPETEVLDFAGKVIPGLYAGGEFTSGMHGSNRLGANGLAEAIVFGREFGLIAKKRYGHEANG